MLMRKNTIEKSIDVKIAVSRNMEDAIELWSSIYAGLPPWVESGSKFKRTLNLGSAIAGEIARLTTMEMKSGISGNPTADYLDKQYQRCIAKAREYTEFACAKGGVILKPVVIQNQGKIDVTVIHAGDFYPTDFDADDITGVIFPDVKIIGDKKYTRLEWHKLDGTDYQIINKAYVTPVVEIGTAADDILGKEIDLTSVPDWEGISPEIHLINIERPLFAYFKMPLANSVESQSPLGVSVYSKATDLIQDADGIWNDILWELYATQAAIFGDRDIFLTDEYGNLKLDEAEKRLYRKVETSEGKLLDFYNPEIRDNPLFHALNETLRKIEFLCGLAYGTISDTQIAEKTATEVIQSKQRSFSLVCDVQKSFEKAHKDLLYAMYALTEIYGLAPSCDFESMDMTFEFDDSIVVDRVEEFGRLMSMVAAGLLKPEYLVAWYFGISEKEALESYVPREIPEKEDEQEEE